MLFEILEVVKNLFLYIFSSASFKIEFISFFMSVLVEAPRDRLKGTLSLSLALFLQHSCILVIKSLATWPVVLGSSIANSSPPHLEIISSFRQLSFKNFPHFIR